MTWWTDTYQMQNFAIHIVQSQIPTSIIVSSGCACRDEIR